MSRPKAAISSLGAPLALGRVALDDAVMGVLVHETERDLVERGLDGGDLREHVDAVALLLDHALHTANLALHPPQAREQLVLGGRVARASRMSLDRSCASL